MKIPIDSWIKSSGLEDFFEKHLRIHLEELTPSYNNEIENVIRYAAVSLRQELEAK